MKSHVFASCAAALLATVVTTAFGGMAGDSPEIRINLDEQPTPKAPPAQAPGKTAPAAKATTKLAATKTQKKPEAPPKIEGMEIARGDRGYLGVAINGGVFKISFYDKDKKPTSADVSAAALRWPVHYQPNDERTFLQPSSDGKSLTSDRIVKPPYSFKLYITLLKATADGQQTPVESYLIDFQQSEG